MAGRGRGRGKAASFDVEQLGFSKGDKMPAPLLEPPPLFPPANRPTQLKNTEETRYLLALKQKFRIDFQSSPFFIKPVEKKPAIERYSDKYQKAEAEKYPYNYDLFPEELRPKKKAIKKEKVKEKTSTSNITSPDKSTTLPEDILGENEHKSVKRAIISDDEDEAGGNKEESDNEEEVEQLEEEDEDLEDETDYGASYFDNGEAFLDPEDDNLEDGPVY